MLCTIKDKATDPKQALSDSSRENLPSGKKSQAGLVWPLRRGEEEIHQQKKKWRDRDVAWASVRQTSDNVPSKEADGLLEDVWSQKWCFQEKLCQGSWEWFRCELPEPRSRSWLTTEQALLDWTVFSQMSAFNTAPACFMLLWFITGCLMFFLPQSVVITGCFSGAC